MYTIKDLEKFLNKPVTIKKNVNGEEYLVTIIEELNTEKAEKYLEELNSTLSEKGVSKVSELEELSNVKIEYNVMINVNLVWTKNVFQNYDSYYVSSIMESAYLKNFMSIGPIDRLLFYQSERNIDSGNDWVKSQMDFRKSQIFQCICDNDYSFLRAWYKELSKNGTEKINYSKYKLSNWEDHIDNAENDIEREHYEEWIKRDRENNINFIEKLIEEIN